MSLVHLLFDDWANVDIFEILVLKHRFLNSMFVIKGDSCLTGSAKTMIGLFVSFSRYKVNIKRYKVGT